MRLPKDQPGVEASAAPLLLQSGLLFGKDKKHLSKDPHMLKTGHRPTRKSRKQHPDANAIPMRFAIGSPYSLQEMLQLRRFSRSEPVVFGGDEALAPDAATSKAKGQQQDYGRLRTLSYPAIGVVLMWFTIGSPDIVENNVELEMMQLCRLCCNEPVILVGNKSDLRNNAHTLSELAKTTQKHMRPGEVRDGCEETSAESCTNNALLRPKR
ncbi:hypothetical protein MTO96_013131 [Rhipicephalus appendiculatus]